MQKRVLILHGLNGSSFPHWQTKLAMNLTKEDFVVSFPALPNKDFPDFDEWKEVVKKEINHFKPDIIVAHSLGNIIWFHICDELNIELEKLLLVAPVTKNCDIEVIKSFFPYSYPSHINAKQSLIISSTNDPYLSVKEAKVMSDELNIELKVLDEAGHINADSGFGDFDFAMKWIMN